MIVIRRVSIDHELFREALRLECEVFSEAGFTDENDLEAGRIVGYESFNSNSVMVVACDRGDIIGVLREIHPDHRGWFSFRTVEDFPEALAHLVDVRQESILEIGTVAIPRRHRGGDLALRLYANALRSNPMSAWWIASLDQRVLKLYRDRLGFRFEPMGAPRHYLGSMTVPVVLAVQECLGDLRHERPRIAAILLREPP